MCAQTAQNHTVRGRTMFAPTVQPVQMNLQTVCRGRTPGHLLLRLCRSKANPPPNGSARVWQCGYGTAPANCGRRTPNRKPNKRSGFITDKTQAYVIMNTRDAVTAVRPLTDQQLKSLTAPGPNPSGQCAFIQKMYSTITAHTRSFQAFFCTRATSFLPLTTGRNVGLTATMQQRPSALYHILSNPVNSTPTRRFFIFTSIFTR